MKEPYTTTRCFRRTQRKLDKVVVSARRLAVFNSRALFLLFGVMENVGSVNFYVRIAENDVVRNSSS